MKKIMRIFLVFILALSLTAFGSNKETDKKGESKSTQRTTGENTEEYITGRFG